MHRLYVALDLGTERGRVVVGTLHQDSLTLSEVRRFPILTAAEKDFSVTWDIAAIYQQVMEALQEVGGYEEHVAGISASSWAPDYLLFGSDTSLISPACRNSEARATINMKKAFEKMTPESIYDETGFRPDAKSPLFQLGLEGRRLKKAEYFLSVADGFNFLLSGVARAEMSQASTTQLFNPATGAWSENLIQALKLPAEKFPTIVPAGTKLGPLRPEIIKETKLDDAHVFASCSHELAAALASLPGCDGHWAFLLPGKTAVMGTELRGPVISDMARELGFSNESGYGGSVRFSKRTSGDSILTECRQYWKENDRELDDEVLTHLAVSSPPFEALINPDDPRFAEPGDMPLKIQAYCKETDQEVPRKPGPIMRCVLESLALQYRKTIGEIEYLTGREIKQLYQLEGSKSDLLTHFTANALQIPVVIAPVDATATGNIIVQALAQKKFESMEQAHELVRATFKTETIHPHADVWNEASERFTELVAA